MPVLLLPKDTQFLGIKNDPVMETQYVTDDGREAALHLNEYVGHGMFAVKKLVQINPLWSLLHSDPSGYVKKVEKAIDEKSDLLNRQYLSGDIDDDIFDKGKKRLREIAKKLK